MKAIINTPTPSLVQSIDFYQKLNFEIVNDNDLTYACSGPLIILINEKRSARAGIIFYNDDWTQVSSELDKKYSTIEIENGILTCDPNGVVVSLYSMDHFPSISVSKEVNSIAGNFHGLSIEAFNFQKSLDFWQIFDYKIDMGSAAGGWVAMSNSTGIGIGMMKFNMCPHLFFNPSFTYFNSGNNLPVIQAIRDKGITITEEITHFNKEGIVDNIIIRDPGGFGFFIFND